MLYARLKMLKRTFHDLIEIKKKIAKLEKAKPDEGTKKRRRIIEVSSSSDEEPSDNQPKSLERKDAPLPAPTSSQKPDKGKSLARRNPRHKKSDAKASRDGTKDSKAMTEPAPDSTSEAKQPHSKKGKKKQSIKK